MRPDGLPIWVSDVAPGHPHDLTVARDAITSALELGRGAQLDLPTLADSGYEGAGQGIKTPIKQPADGQPSPRTTRPTTRCCARPRCLGERGFALLTGRWRALQRVTVSPRRIGELAQAALVLTQSRTSTYAFLVEITSLHAKRTQNLTGQWIASRCDSIGSHHWSTRWSRQASIAAARSLG